MQSDKPSLDYVRGFQDARVSAWRPIDTAPKDGRELLIWTEHGGCWLVYWDKEEAAFLVTDGKNTLYPRGGLATHWQPIPLAPETPNVE